MTSTPEENHGPGPNLTPDDDVEGQPETSPGPAHDHPTNPVEDPTENPGPEDHPEDDGDSTAQGSPGPPPAVQSPNRTGVAGADDRSALSAHWHRALARIAVIGGAG